MAEHRGFTLKEEHMGAKPQVETCTAFKAGDGTIFESKEAAQVHEIKRLRTERIKKFADDHFWSGMISSDVVDILVEYGKELGI